MGEIAGLTIESASTEIKARRLSPVALVKSALEAIATLDASINAFITVCAESALNDAHAVEAQINSGNYLGPLHGIPIAVKDLFDVAGVKTTAASKVLEDNIATKDASAVESLRRAGAIIIGKTNLHEFAYGGSGVVSAYGPTRNPRDPRRIAGGSSSGSAAAVAAGMCVAALGTDTAGSIRLPAAFCGVVGFKPTHGTIRTDGVVALSESLDHIGPIAKTVVDTRILFSVLSGRAHDDTPRASKLSSLSLGFVKDYFCDDIEPEVLHALQAASKKLATAHGFAQVGEIELKAEFDPVLRDAEAYSVHREYIEQCPELYDPETLRRILSGKTLGEATIRQHREILANKRRECIRIFDDVDVIATPTVAFVPPLLSDLPVGPDLRAIEQQLLRNTRPFNYFGWPTITIPCGCTSDNLPVGLQLSAAPGSDFFLLAVAEQVETLLRN